MASMWTADSDRDYYGPSEAEERGWDDEDPLDAYSEEEISLFMTDPGGDVW
jgi:hypothetical protein